MAMRLMGNKFTGKSVEVSIDVVLEDGEQYRIDVSIPSRTEVEDFDVYNDNLYDYFAEIIMRVNIQ